MARTAMDIQAQNAAKTFRRLHDLLSKEGRSISRIPTAISVPAANICKAANAGPSKVPPRSAPTPMPRGPINTNTMDKVHHAHWLPEQMPRKLLATAKEAENLWKPTAKMSTAIDPASVWAPIAIASGKA